MISFLSIKSARSLKNTPKVSPHVHGYVSFLIGFCSCLMNDLHVTSQSAELKAMLLKHFKRSPPGPQAQRPRTNFYLERASVQVLPPAPPACAYQLPPLTTENVPVTVIFLSLLQTCLLEMPRLACLPQTSVPRL